MHKLQRGQFVLSNTLNHATRVRASSAVLTSVVTACAYVPARGLISKTTL